MNQKKNLFNSKLKTQNSKLALLFALLVLPGCATSGLELSVVSVSPAPATIVPGSSGVGRPAGALQVHYALRDSAQVSARLQGLVSATLMSGRQDAGDHFLRFTGVITADQSLDGYRAVRQAVPPGDYTITISAGNDSQSVPVKVSGAESTIPRLDSLLLRPDTISP